MAATRAAWENLIERAGSDVTIHREGEGDACPCRTPEGFRDPAWHLANPSEPNCNEQGFLATPHEFLVKASVQPAFSGLSRHAQRVNALLGEIQLDDQIGFFPISWRGNEVDFEGWSDAGNDYVVYRGNRYLVTSFDLLPDVDGDAHHYEVGLRRIKTERPL